MKFMFIFSKASKERHIYSFLYRTYRIREHLKGTEETTCTKTFVTARNVLF